jgi:outer membrane protein assembly factor BamB
LWRIKLTDGFSSLAISGGRAYTLESRPLEGQDYEYCVALNAATGDELWATPLEPAEYPDGGAGEGDGPRSTPSVDGSLVYALSSHLLLVCMDASTGHPVWTRDLVAEFGGRTIPWQNAASPLLDGDLLFVNCNAQSLALLALRKADGSLAWRGETAGLTHASPVAATILGVRQVIFFTRSGLVSVAPETGEVLWRYAFPFSTSTAASPVVADDIVFCSAAYNIGAAAVRISRSDSTFHAEELWRISGNKVGNHWSTPVHCRGYLYGLFGSYDSAKLKCLDLATGSERWSVTGFGPGGLLLVDEHLLVLSERGELVLIKPDPSACTEVARAQAVTGKCWNAPAISDGHIYARSTSEAVCLDVSVATAPPVITSFPADLTVSCATDVPAPDDSLVTATGDCGGPVVVSHDADVVSGEPGPGRYTITRTYHVTDACGNRVSRTQIITVDDQTPPVITGFPADLTVSCATDVPAPDDSLVTATDDCGGPVVVSHDADVVSGEPGSGRYTITRTYRVTDACGNQSSRSQTISVDIPAQPLRIQSAWLGADGAFELLISLADGTPLEASRVPGIELVSTTDLAVPLGRWTVVTATGVLENGVLRFEGLDPGSAEQRFFMVVEKP